MTDTSSLYRHGSVKCNNKRRANTFIALFHKGDEHPKRKFNFRDFSDDQGIPNTTDHHLNLYSNHGSVFPPRGAAERQERPCQPLPARSLRCHIRFSNSLIILILRGPSHRLVHCLLSYVWMCSGAAVQRCTFPGAEEHTLSGGNVSRTSLLFYFISYYFYFLAKRIN